MEEENAEGKEGDRDRQEGENQAYLWYDINKCVALGFSEITANVTSSHLFGLNFFYCIKLPLCSQLLQRTSAHFSTKLSLAATSRPPSRRHWKRPVRKKSSPWRRCTQGSPKSSWWRRECRASAGGRQDTHEVNAPYRYLAANYLA